MKIGIQITGPEAWQVLAFRDGVRWDGAIVGWRIDCHHVADGRVTMRVIYDVPVTNPASGHQKTTEVQIVGTLVTATVDNGQPYFELETDLPLFESVMEVR